jgi:hypothetical protein
MTSPDHDHQAAVFFLVSSFNVMVAVLDAGVNGWRKHELINNGDWYFLYAGSGYPPAKELALICTNIYLR